jgi:hypothetical protein
MTTARVGSKSTISARAIRNFLRWVTSHGQQYGDELSYARLSQQQLDRVEEKIGEIGPE